MQEVAFHVGELSNHIKNNRSKNQIIFRDNG